MPHTRRLFRTGNSLAVTIPMEIAERLRFKAGVQVTVSTDWSRTMSIEAPPPPRALRQADDHPPGLTKI